MTFIFVLTLTLTLLLMGLFVGCGVWWSKTASVLMACLTIVSGSFAVVGGFMIGVGGGLVVALFVCVMWGLFYHDFGIYRHYENLSRKRDEKNKRVEEWIQ